MTSPSYVLITAAHNEARFLPDTIASVLAQTVRPVAWMIVSDNSTDETDRIAAAAAEAHGFIRFLRFQNPLPRSPHPMGGISWKKVSALRAGLAALGDALACDYLGNLDADVTFAPDFYATLMQRMQAAPDLGIAGGFIYHSSDGREWPYFINPDVVGGPIQFFRRAAWQQIGGYVPWGQEDAIAQMMARMHGWRIQSFGDLRVLHHKTAKEKNRHPLGGKFHAGKMERAMGYHPLYEAANASGTWGRSRWWSAAWRSSPATPGPPGRTSAPSCPRTWWPSIAASSCRACGTGSPGGAGRPDARGHRNRREGNFAAARSGRSAQPCRLCAAPSVRKGRSGGTERTSRAARAAAP